MIESYLTSHTQWIAQLASSESLTLGIFDRLWNSLAAGVYQFEFLVAPYEILAATVQNALRMQAQYQIIVGYLSSAGFFGVCCCLGDQL